MKPLIGINCNFDETLVSTVGAGYYDCVLAAGGLPFLLPPVSQYNDLKALLSLADGLVLVGSKDIPPHLYGESQVHPKTEPIHPRRIEFDFNLIQLAWKIRLPTLAVCGGMQEVNVVFGGTLAQHIPDDYPTSLPHTKERPSVATHRIDIKQGTLLHKTLRVDSCITNSYHHQCVKELPSKFIVSAKSEDGIIEGIEPKDGRFFLALQWHPERMGNDPLQARLFKALIYTARKFRSRK